MIDSDGKLSDFLPAIRAADWVALDTEADSLHAYPEKLCLLQFSLSPGDFLLDPLARLDLSPLWIELHRHRLIMHGADYDLRLLRKNHAFVPREIFDTMIASRLLGEREFGLVHLVRKYLNVILEKGSQKADWARRPLTPRMAAYARNDTHYLKPLADILEERLRALHRLPWLQESCCRLIAECARPPVAEPEEIWRIKGSHVLTRPGLAILRSLWRWREKEAIAANRPPYFVLRHETLVELAVAAAAGQTLEKFIPRYLSDRRREGLRQAVDSGLALPAEDHPPFRQLSSRRQSEAERRRFSELESHRNKIAADLQIDPTVIASRATLLSLARRDAPEANGLMSWQAKLLNLPHPNPHED